MSLERMQLDMTTPNDDSSEVAYCPRLQHNKQGQKRRRHGSDIRMMCRALFEEDGTGCLVTVTPVCDDDKQGVEGCRGDVVDRQAVMVDIEGHMQPSPRQRHNDPAPDPGWSQGIDGSQRHGGGSVISRRKRKTVEMEGTSHSFSDLIGCRIVFLFSVDFSDLSAVLLHLVCNSGSQERRRLRSVETNAKRRV